METDEMREAWAEGFDEALKAAADVVGFELDYVASVRAARQDRNPYQ